MHFHSVVYFLLFSFALGNFIGPSLGGYLVDVVGFRHTTVIFQLMGCVFLVIDVFNLACFPAQTRLQMKRVMMTHGKTKTDLYERLP